jgi:glucose-6-phosphate 1-dehydrogenase
LGIKLLSGNLEFGYKKAFKGEIPSAYERLLLDFMQGDQRLFIGSEEVEAAWRFVDSIKANINFKKLSVHGYKPGTNGPKEAENFIIKDAKEWATR